MPLFQQNNDNFMQQQQHHLPPPPLAPPPGMTLAPPPTLPTPLFPPPSLVGRHSGAPPLMMNQPGRMSNGPPPLPPINLAGRMSAGPPPPFPPPMGGGPNNRMSGYGGNPPPLPVLPPQGGSFRSLHQGSQPNLLRQHPHNSSFQSIVSFQHNDDVMSTTSGSTGHSVHCDCSLCKRERSEKKAKLKRRKSLKRKRTLLSIFFAPLGMCFA